eukprot:864053_1
MEEDGEIQERSSHNRRDSHSSRGSDRHKHSSKSDHQSPGPKRSSFDSLLDSALKRTRSRSPEDGAAAKRWRPEESQSAARGSRSRHHSRDGSRHASRDSSRHASRDGSRHASRRRSQSREHSRHGSQRAAAGSRDRSHRGGRDGGGSERDRGPRSTFDNTRSSRDGYRKWIPRREERARMDRGRNSRQPRSPERRHNSRSYHSSRRDGRDRKKEEPKKTKEEIEDGRDRKKGEPKKTKEEIERELHEYEKRVLEQMEQIGDDDEDSVDEVEAARLRRQRRARLAPSEPAPTELNGTVAADDSDEEEEEVATESNLDIVKRGEQSEKNVVMLSDSDDDGCKIDQHMMDMFDLNAVARAPVVGKSATGEVVDSWDDPEGYYMYRSGELLNGKFEVFGDQGRGVFSSVLRVRDKKALEGDDVYVVKVIRCNDVMYKAGVKELEYLNMLKKRDPDNKKHCVRLISQFEHRDHLCMVFEAMSLNLRQLLKRLGNVGISVHALRSYATQMFVALRLVKKCGLVHADIKPDNILVNEKRNIIKLCDFGSATTLDDCTITPYLCSRYYRAPEIMLGCPYDCSSDMWSMGCVLFELYTGKIMFKGRTNNAMLNLFMEVRGKIPNRVLKKGAFTSMHFDSDLAFLLNKTDEVTQTVMKKKIPIIKQKRDLLTAMHPAQTSVSFNELPDNDRRKVLQLKDLLERCLCLDPSRRITPEQALKHQFIKDP